MQLAALNMAMQTARDERVPSSRLVQAAHEFEGQIMKELLRPVNNGDALEDADDDSDSGEGSGGALGEFAAESLSRSLSEHGGFGIANRIIQELSHSRNQQKAGK